MPTNISYLFNEPRYFPLPFLLYSLFLNYQYTRFSPMVCSYLLRYRTRYNYHFLEPTNLARATRARVSYRERAFYNLFIRFNESDRACRRKEVGKSPTVIDSVVWSNIFPDSRIECQDRVLQPMQLDAFHVDV